MHCSFCGNTRDEAKLCIIVGPGGIGICDECVEECKRMIMENKARKIWQFALASAFEELWGTDV